MGDNSERDRLISEHSGLVTAVLRKYTPGKRYDPDYIQQAWLGLCEAANNRHKVKSNFRSYAYVCIRNHLISLSKKDKHYSQLDEEDARYDPEEDNISQAEASIIIRRIERDDDSRLAYILAARVSGKSNREISAELGLSEARISQLLQKVRRYL